MDRGLTRVDSLEKVGGNWLACLYIKIYYKTSRIKIDFIGTWIERLANVTEFPEIDANIYIYIYTNYMLISQMWKTMNLRIGQIW